jgi:hypothetical protein
MTDICDIDHEMPFRFGLGCERLTKNISARAIVVPDVPGVHYNGGDNL